LYFLEYQTIDKVQKLSDPECCTPLSDPFKINMAENLDIIDSEQRSLVSDSDSDSGWYAPADTLVYSDGDKE
jgi:hypothetical protein